MCAIYYKCPCWSKGCRWECLKLRTQIKCNTSVHVTFNRGVFSSSNSLLFLFVFRQNWVLIHSVITFSTRIAPTLLLLYNLIGCCNKLFYQLILKYIPFYCIILTFSSFLINLFLLSTFGQNWVQYIISHLARTHAHKSFIICYIVLRINTSY